MNTVAFAFDGVASVGVHQRQFHGTTGGLISEKHLGRARGIPRTPVHQREDDLSQVTTGFGEVVLVAWRVVLIRMPFQQPVGHQRVQSTGQGIGGDAQAGQEFIETAQPVERIPQDQQAPTITDVLQSAGDRLSIFSQTLLVRPYRDSA